MVTLTERSAASVVFDPATYPGIMTFDDVRSAGVEVHHVTDAPVIDYLRAVGALDDAQLVGGFDGGPAGFVAARGAIAQVGDVTVDAALLPLLPQWARPVATLAAAEVGWQDYDELLVVADDDERLSDECLGRLTRVVQQAIVAYVADPAPTIDLMVDLRNQFTPLNRITVPVMTAGFDLAIDNGVFSRSADPPGATRPSTLDTFLTELADAIEAGGIEPEDVVTDRYIDPRSHRQVERGDLPERFAERRNRCLEQFDTTLDGCSRRIADVSVGPEVVRQPSEADRATEADVTIPDECVRNVPHRGVHVDEIGSEVQHDRRLVGAAVDPHAVLVGCGDPTLVGRNARMCEERHQTVVQTELTVGDAHERRVATVTVHEHESPGRSHRNAASDVVEDLQQGVGRQPDRARRPGVLVRLGVGERGKQPDVMFDTDALDRRRRDAVGNHQIGVEREVWPVLFDGAQRLDEDRAVGDQPIEIRGPKLVEAARDGRDGG